MTQKQALAKAVALWGKKAMVQIDPKAGRIGQHGEYLPFHVDNQKPDSPKCGRYRCKECSTTGVDDEGNYFERSVWHRLGGVQPAYKVGRVELSMFFSVEGEGDSFEAAFKCVEAKRQALGRAS